MVSCCNFGRNSGIPTLCQSLGLCQYGGEGGLTFVALTLGICLDMRKCAGVKMEESPKSPKEIVISELESIAKGLGLTTRLTAAGVLHTCLDDTVSFSTLDKWNGSCKALAKANTLPIEDLLLSQGANLLIATRIGLKRPREEQSPITQHELDTIQERICQLVKKLEKNAVKDSTKKEELEAARTLLERSTATLFGPSGAEEKAVQSFGLFQRRLGASDPRPRLVAALRLNAGVPLRIASLKAAMGTSWADGAVTVSDSVSGVDSVQLPLTDEGEASKAFGNLPLLLVTSIPVV